MSDSFNLHLPFNDFDPISYDNDRYANLFTNNEQEPLERLLSRHARIWGFKPRAYILGGSITCMMVCGPGRTGSDAVFTLSKERSGDDGPYSYGCGFNLGQFDQDEEYSSYFKTYNFEDFMQFLNIFLEAGPAYDVPVAHSRNHLRLVSPLA